MPIGLERRSIALVAGASIALIWSNTLALICADLLDMPGPLPLAAISAATIGLGILTTLLLARAAARPRQQRAAALSAPIAGAGLALALDQSYSMPAILLPALLLAGAIYAIGLPWIAGRLPSSLDHSRARHRRDAAALALLGALVVAQTARLSIFMGDISQVWASALPHEGLARVSDLAVYVYAADLYIRDVDNLYDVSRYPNDYPSNTLKRTTVRGLAPHLMTHFEYPPPFLLLPLLALKLTHTFATIRAVWFALDATLILLIMVALARWVGGRAGQLALWLLPALWITLPVLFDLQLGQFHLTSIALSIAAMLAFDRGRAALGGAMLAVAVVAKLFPGLLVVYLLLQKRWRAAAWTTGLSLLLGLLGLLILGPKPYLAFVTYQMPRIARGEALAFWDWEIVSRLINESLYGLVDKLILLGLPGDGRTLTSVAAGLYTLLLLGLTAVAARSPMTRLRQAQVWLALLSLAALRSPHAPGSYVTVSTLWLSTFLLEEFRGRLWQLALINLILLSLVFPLPLPLSAQLLWSLLGQLCLFGLNIATIARRQPASVRQIEELAAPLSAS